VNRLYDELALLGTAPQTLRLLQDYISDAQGLQSRRKHAGCKSSRCYYYVDMFEDEQLKALKKSSTTRFLPATKRIMNLTNRLMGQAFINDLFLAEVRSGHRLAIQMIFNPVNDKVFCFKFTLNKYIILYCDCVIDC